LTNQLPSIPVVETDADFPLATLRQRASDAQALMDLATRGVPRTALRGLDAISRRWLARQSGSHLDEVDAVARLLGRPGAYFLSVNYEWGCTCRVMPSAGNAAGTRLVRVLDWRTRGLGRFCLAARVQGRGIKSFTTLTWPGYTGVLQAMAPGRFAAALNQAPMRQKTSLYPLDWAMNRATVWRRRAPTPAALLREVFETADDFEEALAMLWDTPIASPAIFIIGGVRSEQMAIIERQEDAARVHGGEGVAANHWMTADWTGLARGEDSHGRSKFLAATEIGAAPPGSPAGQGTGHQAAFEWLKPPVLNDRTRLALIAEPATGRLTVQGFENGAPATNVLELV